MQLSLYADYGCRVLIFLACMDQEQSSVEEISRSFGISQNHLVKVVHGLSKFGFIETTRGRGGGIRLGTPPSEINMGQVVRKMEPHFHLVECFDTEANTCPIIRVCGLKAVLYKAREAFFRQLDEVSLQDIALQPRPIIAALQTQAKKASE